jgi:tetratricopeptide (TPR) repeat protein
VETAVQESSTRLNVRNDPTFQSLLADVRQAPIVTVAADYGAGAAMAKTAGTFLDRGILFAMRGDFELAIADFSEAIQLDGTLATAYVLRGRAVYATVSKVTSIEEGFSRVKFNVAGANISNEQKALFARAATDFTQAIRIDPNNKIAYRERGLMYSEQGDKDRAIADYTQAIRLDPNYAAAYMNRGSAYDAKGDHDRAIEDYTEAIRIDPNGAEPYFSRGRGYYLKGDYDRAIADCNQAIEFNPNYANAYSIRGLAYSDKKDYDRAIADYNQTIRLDPNNADLYNNRGNVYYYKNDYDRAIADYERALQIRPNHTNAKNNLEIVRQLRGR